MLNRYQITFAILKPHILKNPFAYQTIHKMIVENQLNVLKSEQILLGKEIAENFYAEHKTKFFYNRLLTFMNSGKSEALILSGENAIEKWRNLMGPTKVYKTIFTHPDSIRGLFGLTDTRNACHGSDSPESVRREIRIVFPEFCIDQYDCDGGDGGGR